MKLIVGIIAHDADEYVRQAQQISRWSYRDTESYYIKFGSESVEKITPGTYYAPALHEETVETAIIKVLHFMKYALTREWDFMLRTNLSSVFHWGRAFEMLDQYGKSHDVIGNIVFNDFVTGCGMFLSRSVVKGIVDLWLKGEHIELNYDDVVLGRLIKKSGFPMSTWKHTEYLMVKPMMDVRTADNYFHLRCKLTTDVPTRVLYEIPMMKKFVEYLKLTDV
jgi:hypothetical protein